MKKIIEFEDVRAINNWLKENRDTIIDSITPVGVRNIEGEGYVAYVIIYEVNPFE